MESIISTFHIDWKIIIAQGINFGVVFFVLYRYAIKPLLKTMNVRQEKIAQGLKDAKDNADILLETETKHEEILSQARLEAHEVFQDIKNEAEIKKAEIIEEAKKEAIYIVENGKKILENEKRKMISEEHEEIIGLIIKGTEKLLGQKSDASLNEKAIKDLSAIL